MKLTVILATIAVCVSCTNAQDIDALCAKLRDFIQNTAPSLLNQNKYSDLDTAMIDFKSKVPDLLILPEKSTQINELVNQVIAQSHQAQQAVDSSRINNVIKPKSYTAMMQILPLLVTDKGKYTNCKNF